MLIQDWMAKDVLTVDENTSLMRATRIMKEKGIRRLPVVSHGKLTGIVTDRDVKDASPSKNTSLDVHELYYLLSEMKVREVMTPTPLTLNGHDSLEKAAVIMLEKRISGVPIISTDGSLEGLLSETDVLRGFIRSTGIQDGAIQFVFDLDDTPGSVTNVVKKMREHNARVVSVLTSFEDASTGKKRVAIRVMAEEGCNCEELTTQLTSDFSVVFHGMDELKEL